MAGLGQGVHSVLNHQEKEGTWHLQTLTGPISFNAGDWVTSGTYVFIDIYDPEYQRIFTSHEAPAAWNYFGQG